MAHSVSRVYLHIPPQPEALSNSEGFTFNSLSNIHASQTN